MEVTEKKNYFYVPNDILTAPLTPLQFKIACTFCKTFNPGLTYKRSIQTHNDIVNSCNNTISLRAIKYNLKKLMILLPQFFKGRKRIFGQGYAYIFEVEYKQSTKVTAAVESQKSDMPELSDTDMRKLALLKSLKFPVRVVQEFLKYDLNYISRNVAYLVDQMTKREMNADNYKYPKIFLNYVRQCFNEDWGYGLLSKSAKQNDLSRVDQVHLNGQLNTMVDKMKLQSEKSVKQRELVE